MTIKKKNNGQSVKKSKDFKSQAKAQLTKVGVFLVSLGTIGIWFVAIFLMATALGWFLHVMPEKAPWVPLWMFQVGHYIEYGLFGADCVSLIYAVGKELHEMFVGESHDEDESEEDSDDPENSNQPSDDRKE